MPSPHPKTYDLPYHKPGLITTTLLRFALCSGPWGTQDPILLVGVLLWSPQSPFLSQLTDLFFILVLFRFVFQFLAQDLVMQFRRVLLTLQFHQSSCLSLLKDGITGKCHHTQCS